MMHPLSRHTGTLITALLAVLTLMLSMPSEMRASGKATVALPDPVLGALKISE